MFRLWCSKVPSLRPLATRVSSPLICPCCPLSSLNPSFTRNSITTTTSRLPSRQLSSRMDPKSLMMDLESDLFNYTTGRFLYVSYILSSLCLTHNVTYSVQTTPFASKNAGASSTSPVSSKSLPRLCTAKLKRLSVFASSEKVASTVLFSSP